MSKDIKYILQLLGLFLFMLFTNCFLLPYAQKSADSHSGTNDLLTILFFITSVSAFVLLIYKILKKHQFISIAILILYFVTLLFFWFKLCDIVCYSCSQG